MIAFDDRAAVWVARQLKGGERGFGPCRGLGSFRDGRIIGGVAFHNWNPESRTIEVSAAGRGGWVNRTLIGAACDYIFFGLGCETAIAQVLEENAASIGLIRKLGADVHLIPHLGGTQGKYLCTLTAQQWRASRFNRS